MSAEGGNNGEWCTVESDPGVFTELLEQIGCSGVELDELYSLDDDSLVRLKASTGKVYGLIFLFKWVGKQQEEHVKNSGEPLSEDAIPPNLFFAHQVTTNACATQAILSVVLNAGLSETELGSTLHEFQSFTASFPPALKGVAISSSDEIKKAHNAFSRQDAFLQEGKYHVPTDADEAFHFVAYVPSDGTVYELDGLQKGPIVVGTYGRREEGGGGGNDNDNNDNNENKETKKDDDWLTVAARAIQGRMAAGGDHIKFNCMAVMEDKRIVLEREMEDISAQCSGEIEDEERHAALLARCESEDAKRAQWRVENQRRRHNYVPLCVQLFKELARKGTLPQLVTEARERHATKRQKRLENNKKQQQQKTEASSSS